MAATSNYQVLARRYRPQLFRDVIGQQAVVHQLHNEISEGRIGHGYLFCGPRGTGKTSMARIFAKALNCVNGPTTEPCGKCSHCLEIAGGTHLDIIEVDAATYTKVDDMRELLGGINRSAFSARYKVYIIDEVHMLSNSSFNALLKNLEEPPANVVFILATTNPEKIPETVISRCRRCNFDRISVQDVTKSLTQILEKEGVKIAEDEHQAVLNSIALACDGGLRDAQVLLDQLISLTDDELRLETVRSLLGVVEGDVFLQLLKSLVERDTANCLLIVGDMVDRGRDLQRFVKMFLGFLRDAMIIKAGGGENLLRIIDSSQKDMRELLNKTTLPFLLNVVQQFLDLEERMRGAAPPRFLMEFALIKLTAIDPRLVLDSAFAGLAGDDRRPTPPGGGGARSSRASAPSTRQAPAQRTAPRSTGPTASAAVAVPVMNDSAVTKTEAAESEPVIETIHTTEADRWGAFVAQVSDRNPTIRGTLAKARLAEAAQNKLIIELSSSDRAMRPTMDRAEIVAVMREAAQAIWKRPMMPKFIVSEPEQQASAPEEELAEPEYLPEPEAEEDLEPIAVAESNLPPLPAPPPKPLTFKQALEKFPKLREACELIESHFGIEPVSFNGSRIS